MMIASIFYTAETHTGLLFGYGATADQSKDDLRASLRARGYRAVGAVMLEGIGE